MRRTIAVLAVSMAACGPPDIKKQPPNATPNNQNIATNGATNGMTNVATNGATNGGTNGTTDRDGDGVPNAADNCPAVENPAQDDTDGDSVGDVCDNCPETANVDQIDGDGDDQGDACTGDHFYSTTRDADGDTIFDIVDNCPDVRNPDQTDGDGDSVGDACDNCPDVPNYDQTDSDGNGRGDSCSLRPTGTECPVAVQPLKPDFWLLIDNSGSMGDDLVGYRAALTEFTDAFASTTRFGVSGQSDSGTVCTDTEIRDLGDWTSDQMSATWTMLETSGASTPNVGLEEIRTGNYLTDPADPFTDQRSKTVVMTTDSPGNSCQDIATATDAAAALAAEGVTVHVIGYLWDDIEPTQWLADVASAGGGSRFLIDNPSDLTATLSSLRSELGDACVHSLAEVPDPTKVWVSVDGTFVARGGADGFELDIGRQTVTLRGASCDLASNGATVEIVTGCETPCQASDEVCDYVDNDCDMVADESCTDCAPEVCNGVDDDCDDEADEGCP